MPIRPENAARYPADWPEVSLAIRERAGWRCEGSPAYPDCRASNGHPHPDTGSIVVLTVAHMDNTPENCLPENLRAWCQRCHLNYDRAIHLRNAYENRRRGKAICDLFQEPA
jgi:hypothetical protein